MTPCLNDGQIRRERAVLYGRSTDQGAISRVWSRGIGQGLGM